MTIGKDVTQDAIHHIEVQVKHTWSKIKSNREPRTSYEDFTNLQMAEIVNVNSINQLKQETIIAGRPSTVASFVVRRKIQLTHELALRKS